jgi:proline-specific peptidase
MQNPKVYHTMWGPSEFFATGTLKAWDIIHRLGEIRLSTLVVSGRYDEATPTIAQTIQQGIPNAEWVVFEQSAHVPHLEETDRFLDILEQFLRRVETQSDSDLITRI